MRKIFHAFYIALCLLFTTLLTGCFITDYIGDCFGDSYFKCVYVNGTEDTIVLAGAIDGRETFRVSLAPNEEYATISRDLRYSDEFFLDIDSFTYSNGTVEWTLKEEKAERDIRPYRDLFDQNSYADYIRSERCEGSHTYVYKFVDEDFTETKPKN